MGNNTTNITKEIQKVLNDFKIKFRMTGFEEFKSGHINTTYLVHTITEQKEVKEYVIQKINSYVFKNPIEVMNNIDLVTTYIRNKDPNATLHFHHTEEGKNYIIEGDSVYRLYTFLNGKAFDEYDIEILENCGRAFGEFQNLLQGFDSNLLKETIPNFHNTKARYEHLLETIKRDPLGRVSEVQEEIKKVEALKEYALKIHDMYEKNMFPIRTTHNDTKTNNVLLNATTLEPISVIDLDTVMPGLIMHDFGDAIRYGANLAKEDEEDLSRVKLSLPMFYAFARGFIKPIKNMLTKNELDTMALGAITMTFEVAIRFLDDYIDGDNYFKISYTTHNYVRSRCQLKLCEDMITKLDEMNKIISII